MEKTLTINGAFADWTLTVAVTPLESADEEPITEWPSTMDHLDQFFYALVNCCESARDAELVRGRRR
ncbi:hypothetical protein SAMN06265360_11449 [Haloechinothrix alba]|uniref:Uncharacterized protein n=1 Tax=Haloechinothrix alba TaxID=664784 RepID=A0A238Y9Y5_9PSEU|nr:hypothetical protein [Haloechinothrix alba]SNR67404.1 hypothetical protein SAMN06265360_11449 [Haloechinothrix alba]